MHCYLLNYSLLLMVLLTIHRSSFPFEDECICIAEISFTLYVYPCNIPVQFAFQYGKKIPDRKQHNILVYIYPKMSLLISYKHRYKIFFRSKRSFVTLVLCIIICIFKFCDNRSGSASE